MANVEIITQFKGNLQQRKQQVRFKPYHYKAPEARSTLEQGEVAILFMKNIDGALHLVYYGAAAKLDKAFVK